MNAPITSKNTLYADSDGRMVQITQQTDKAVHFCDQGGGFDRWMPADKFAAKFKPAELPGFKAAGVSADWLPEGFTAPAFLNGKKWNGWAMPYFTLDAAKTLLPHMPSLSYSSEQDAFIAFEVEAPEGEQETLFQAETIQVDGAAVKVYAIGSGYWCWDEEDATTDTASPSPTAV